MGWLTSLPTAVVLDRRTETTQKFRVTYLGSVANLLERTVIVTTEYRGLTEALAVASVDGFTSDSRTYSDWQPFTVIIYRGIIVTGTKVTASARRQNEARGWRLTVTTVTTTTYQG